MSTTTIEYLTINIPTYPWSGRDKEPPFIREFTPRGQPIYPYTSMEKISDQKEDREYKAVILENEFLKLTFLPEMNGRLYSAFDKVNKREMFYNNPQIKPSLFGLRGAWCANGVEYNFPNSHSTTTLEPIEFKAVKNNDGSASFICGDCEHVSRMLWSVEVILRPGHAVIEMQTKLYNPTAYPKRFYYWMNAAIPVFQETQFIYPESTQRLYTHPPMDISRIAYIDYPVHKGHDISLFKNIPQHLPIFAEETEEDFFGVYHHHLDSGVVHVADHALVKGRKIWTFGNQRDGRIWIDLLTDSGIDYCEVQTGPFTLQSDYRLLAPGKMHLQKDFWLPVNHLGGFNAASEKLVANIKQKGRKVSIKLNPVCDISDALIVVSHKGKISGEKKMSLKTLKTENLSLNCNSASNYSVDIFDANGNSLLHYSPVVEKKSKPILKNRPKKKNSYLEGNYWEQQGFSDRAYTFYSEDKAPNSVIAKARMDMDSGLFAKAFKDLQDVLTLEPENAEALLYTSRCLKQLGKYKLAEKCLSKCCNNTVFLQDALLELAEISVLQRNYIQAKNRLEYLAGNYQISAYAAALYALVLRKTGAKEMADKVLKHAEEIHPFEPFIYGETFFLNGKNILKELRGQIVLEIVTRYMNLNQNKDALKILDTYLKTAGSVLPLMLYYKAYLGKTDVPENLNGEWDFIFRNESENILKYALKKNADDYLALYHLGNFYANKRRWKDALKCWRRVKHYDYKSLALRAEGVYWWKINVNIPKAVECYKQAVNLENCGARTVWEYDHLLEEIGDTGNRLALFKKHEKLVLSDNRLLLRKADAMVASGKPAEALEILMHNKFLLCEGKIQPRLLFEDACWQMSEYCKSKGSIEEALSYLMKPLEYPENLGVGKPAANMETEWYWRCGRLCREKGDKNRAIEFYKKGTEAGTAIPINFFPLKNLVWYHDSEMIELPVWLNILFRAACFKELGEIRKYKKLCTQIKGFLDTKKQEQRTGEPEVIILNYLINILEDNESKSIPNVPRTIPYLRLLQTFFYDSS